jgi:hypothetical protein
MVIDSTAQLAALHAVFVLIDGDNFRVGDEEPLPCSCAERKRCYKTNQRPDVEYLPFEKDFVMSGAESMRGVASTAYLQVRGEQLAHDGKILTRER